ncbi:MAG: ABC transporter ATP-binding protein [Solirubrobacteraceae bacterium]|nr:ABC transporter ATP-binding protein [Solirubrobacteraceae bacterium]
MLEVTGLSAGYGPVRALRDVSFSVEPQTITAVLGANGAGKTTLLRALSGLIGVSSGSVALRGDDITSLATEDIARLGVAHVPEGGGVIRELTVDENLRLGGLIAGAGESERDVVLALFRPLQERLGLPASTLSGGERQMLALGRALMARPTLLLLDEPSLGLAPRVVVQMMAVLRRLRDERGMTVLLVEQKAEGALAVADRAVVLRVGEVMADEPAEALQGADPKLRHAYLGY